MATLNFKGKTFVQNHHLTVKYHQLIPKKEKSKYLDTDYLLEYRIDYCQLPFEIYKLKE